MYWFKIYHGFGSDSKLGFIAHKCGCPRAVINGLFLDMLEYASSHRERGSVSSYDKEAASFHLGITPELVESATMQFEERGLVENGRIANWESYQSNKDDSSDRVRRYRQRMREGGHGGEYIQYTNAIMERDNYKCVYCESENNLCIDHVIPLLRGGSNGYGNLVTACKKCNSGKSGRTPCEAGYKFKNFPKGLEYIVSECNGDSNTDKKRREKKKIYTPQGFDQFWEVYPRREGKKKAMDAYAKCSASPETIWAGAKKYAEAKRGTDAQYIKLPSTWLNGEHWNDEFTDDTKPAGFARSGL